MARFIMVLFGVGIFALGIWSCLRWWDAVRVVLLAFLALGLVIFGLTVLIFGISEMVGARPVRTPTPPPAEEP